MKNETNQSETRKIFRPSSRGNNASIRQSETARMPKQDALIVVATFLTAVAAGASALAAFRQEQATFTSQLYNKQIEIFAAIETSISNYIRNVNAIQISMKTDNICGKSKNPEGYDKELEVAFTDLESRINAGRFVAPDDYRGSLIKLHGDLSGLHDQIKRAYVNGNICDKLEPLTHFVTASDNLFTCSLDNLAKGEPLKPDTLNSCYGEKEKPGDFDYSH